MDTTQRPPEQKQATTQEKPQRPRYAIDGAPVVQKPGLMSLSPRNFEELWQMAELISKTEFVPSSFKGSAAAVVAAVQMGAEVGLKPMTSLKWIAVINGRPSIWGDGALMLARAHPRFESIKELNASEAETKEYGECTIKCKDSAPVTVRYTKQMAITEGVWGGKGSAEKKEYSPWARYPGRMLQMRARSWCIRDAIPEAMGGLSLREEMTDMGLSPRDITEEAKAYQEPEPPKPTIDDKLNAMAEKMAPTAEKDEKVDEPQKEGGKAAASVDKTPPQPRTPKKASSSKESLQLTPDEQKAESEGPTTEEVLEWTNKAQEYAGDEAKMMAYLEASVPAAYHDECWKTWRAATF